MIYLGGSSFSMVMNSYLCMKYAAGNGYVNQGSRTIWTAVHLLSARFD